MITINTVALRHKNGTEGIMGRKKKEYFESVIFTIPAIFLVSVVFYIPFLMFFQYFFQFVI